MRTRTPMVVEIGAAGSDGTTDPAGPTRIAKGEMAVRGDATPPVRIGPAHNSARPAHPDKQAATQAPAHIGRELPTHPAGTEKNRFRTKSNRQPSRWTFCPRNALFRKLSNRSSRDMPLILYLVWPGCSWSDRNATGSGSVR